MEGQKSGAFESPRHKPLRRSLSAQPEESTLSSSPYSTRRKSKHPPGRSLTEYFTSTQHRSERGSSSDAYCGSFRHRTVATRPPGLSSLKEIGEDGTCLSPKKTLPESDYTQFSSLEVYQSSAKNKDGGILYESICYVVSPELSGDVCVPGKRGGFDCMTDTTGLASSPIRKRPRITNGNNEQNEKSCQATLWNLVNSMFKIFFWMTACVLSVLVLIIGTSTFFAYYEAICEQQKNVILPVNDLKVQLSQRVIGQDMAVDLILKSVGEINKGYIGMPLVLWVVGGLGTGKTLTMHILKEVLSGVLPVHVIIPSLLPLDDKRMDDEVSALFHKLVWCSPSLIVIDGWDDQSNTPVKVLKKVLANFHNYRTNGYDLGQLVLVLSGTRGSEEISRQYFELRQNGNMRTDLSIDNFKTMITFVKEATLLSEVTEHYIFVPFLPLEVSQVKQCIRNEMMKLLKLDTVLQEDDLQSIPQKVIDQLSFIPVTQPLMSASGCKRVQPLLSLLLPGFSPTQTSQHYSLVT